MQPIQRWQLLSVSLADWSNRHPEDAIAYIQEEKRILKGKLKGSACPEIGPATRHGRGVAAEDCCASMKSEIFVG